MKKTTLLMSAACAAVLGVVSLNAMATTSCPSGYNQFNVTYFGGSAYLHTFSPSLTAANITINGVAIPSQLIGGGVKYANVCGTTGKNQLTIGGSVAAQPGGNISATNGDFQYGVNNTGSAYYILVSADRAGLNYFVQNYMSGCVAPKTNAGTLAYYLCYAGTAS
ncbi:MAG: hypothetical protein A3E82_09200 [Gammaproteobacteria bacterium RIFCSPHIGHO2_12_FULL_38_11]|nr:MAG: hypothetical protein A3E82_09200 [Gammaproteobacteria bacterium RIFCSPHIGHO2_12_FULL_38_11]